MITKEKAYKTSDGKVHATLTDAQKAELEALFVEISREVHQWDITQICDSIVSHMDRIKDILGTTETSRPRARKVNKVKKKSISERTTEILNNAVLTEKRKRETVQNMAKHGIIPAGEMIDLVNLRPEPTAA